MVDVRLLKSALVSIISFIGLPEALADREPPYKLLRQSDIYEVRAYDNRLVAEVAYGHQDYGFRVLFAYISGANQRRGPSGQPEAIIRSSKIEMTTPVQRIAIKGGQLMQFFLPQGFTLESAPRPTDPRVRLRQLAAANYAVIRYSGRASPASFAHHRALLETWLKAEGIDYVGPAIQASYDSPYKAPFLRRNEVLFQLR